MQHAAAAFNLPSTVCWVGTSPKVFGYKTTKKVCSGNELTKALKECQNKRGSTFIEVMSSKGSRSNLGRPTSTPIQNKESIMKTLSKND
mgnify:CR=1 FL=1